MLLQMIVMRVHLFSVVVDITALMTRRIGQWAVRYRVLSRSMSLTMTVTVTVTVTTTTVGALRNKGLRRIIIIVMLSIIMRVDVHDLLNKQ